MKDKFLKQLKHCVSNSYNYRYLLAVSGGRDSSVLSHLFHHCGLTFAIAHCNFHLRGHDSDLDALHVAQMAKQYHVPLFSIDFDTFGEQKKRGISLEMTARDLRYQWFAQIGETWDFIVTAHHANDAAETLLLNLTRGTGLKGLTSIPEKNGKIIRPLLPFPAVEIENYAKKNKIAFRTDNSNFDLQFQRNRIRHNIIPQLEMLNPQFINILTQNIAHFRQSYQFHQNQLQQIINKLLTISSTETAVNISSLLKHPDSALLLFEILNSYGFNGAQSTQIFESLTGESGKIFYSKTHSAVKNRDSLIIRILNNKKTLDKPVIFNCYADLTSFGFTVTTICYTPDFQFDKNPNLFYTDADKVQFPLTLRTWQYGDKFHPFGMKGNKKVSDFFTDAKIDIQKKQSIKLLCQGSDIMWIVGYRADDRFKITASTKTILIIEQHNIP